ncbi:putative oxidoreductase [Pseudomonas sp. TE3786]
MATPISRTALTPSDWGLLWLRVAGSLLLLQVHGLPKLLHFNEQLSLIEDPWHLGAKLTLSLAIFAEVLCPLPIILGVFTRLACLPILAVLLVALLFVHPEWSLAEAQFAWLLALVFSSVLIAGPGRIALSWRLPGLVYRQ